MSQATEWSGDNIAQVRSQRQLCFDLIFLFSPWNSRNHKDFSSLRNCHEMNGGYEVSGDACEANTSCPLLKYDRSTSEMWKQMGAISHVGSLKAKYSSCLSYPEPINEVTVWIVWIWPAEWHYPLSPAQLKIKLRRIVLKACYAEVIALFLL